MKKIVAKIVIFSDDADETLGAIIQFDDVMSTVVLEEEDNLTNDDLDAWYIEEYGEPYFDPIDWE